jgi:hypothetical protein
LERLGHGIDATKEAPMARRLVLFALALAVLVAAAAPPAADACGCNLGSCVYCRTDSNTNDTTFQSVGGTSHIRLFANACGSNSGVDVWTSVPVGCGGILPGSNTCSSSLSVYDGATRVYYQVCSGQQNCHYHLDALPIPAGRARIVATHGHSTGLTTSEGVEHTLSPPLGNYCCGACDDGNACTNDPCDFYAGCLAKTCRTNQPCQGGAYCNACAIDKHDNKCKCL